MDGISPIHVHEAQIMHFPRPAWRTLVSVAACLAVMIVVYVGLPALMYGSSATPGPEPAAPAETPSAVGSPVSAAEAAVKYLRMSPWLNLGSLLLGLTAWVLPVIALFRRQRHKAIPLISLTACALSLLLQVCNVLHRVNTGDLTTLTDTMWFVMLAAAALAVGTVLFNLAVCVKQQFQKK